MLIYKQSRVLPCIIGTGQSEIRMESIIQDLGNSAIFRLKIPAIPAIPPFPLIPLILVIPPSPVILPSPVKGGITGGCIFVRLEAGAFLTQIYTAGPQLRLFILLTVGGMAWQSG